MPLGVGHQLLAYDIAWLYQPYLAFMAALLALALYALLERVVDSRWLRAAFARSSRRSRRCCTATSSGAAIKEVAGAWLIALVAALRAVDARGARPPSRAAAGGGLRDARLRAEPPRRRLARRRSCSRSSRSSPGARRAELLARRLPSRSRPRVLAIPAFVACDRLAADHLPAFAAATSSGT